MQSALRQGFAVVLLGSTAIAQTAFEVKPASEAVELVKAAPRLDGAPIQPPQSELSYRLGSGDQISISVVEIQELQSLLLGIGTDGIIALPLIGRVQAAGFTVRDLTAMIEQRLQEYVLDPHVAVNVIEFRSQPVSILGAVRNPGVHQLQGRKTVVELLSQAGGIREDAGYQLRITRRADSGSLPVAGAHLDESGQYWVAEVDLDELTEGLNPQANIEIMPHDVISVPTGKMIYAIGALNRVGGFVLSERQEMSVLELLALAGGVDSAASKRGARILRPKTDGPGRDEISVDLKDVLKNEGSDIPLYSGDILVVPESGSKKALTAAVAAGVSAGTGIAIWRMGRGAMVRSAQAQ